MNAKHVKDYDEYLSVLKQSFAECDQMPEDSEILSFINYYSLNGDWDIDIYDIKLDLNGIYDFYKKTEGRELYSYKEYLEALEEEFGTPEYMPENGEIEVFIQKYHLDDMYNITVDDVEKDLEENLVKSDSTPQFFSRERYDHINSYYSPAYDSYDDDYDYEPKYTLPKSQKKPTHKTNKQSKKKQDVKEYILIDGDNHFDEGQKGIEHTPRATKVESLFSQKSTKGKFDRKFGNRPNVSSKFVKPGNQAVDNQIMKKADELLKKENVNVIIVSQDKDFERYAKSKKKDVGKGRISTAKSVKEAMKKRK